MVGIAGRVANASLCISQSATLYSLCLTLLQQEVQLEHTRKQHVVRHETSVPERRFSPVQVSLQKAKTGLRLDPCATLNPVTLILSKSEPLPSWKISMLVPEVGLEPTATRLKA